MGEPHVYGWATIMTALLLRRQAGSGGMHVQREFTGDSPAERLLEPVQKNISEGLFQVPVLRGLPDLAHLVPHHQSQREVRPSSSGGQRSRTSTYARRSVMQAGGKGGQQLLTSWLRSKTPSILRTSAGDRGGQRLLTSWMRPKSSSAPTVSAAPVTAMEYLSPAPEVCAATLPVVEISSPTLATGHAETERLFFVRCTFCSQCPSRVRRVPSPSTKRRPSSVEFHELALWEISVCGYQQYFW